MYTRIGPETGPKLTVHVDGRPVTVRAGDSVAAAAMLAGLLPTRLTPVSGAPRAPYCMMGVCFECLMTIDGVAARQACLESVREGMRIEVQSGRRTLAP
jgi:predicted molibdopterin-dependent oxidoreductase YjgC